VVRLHSYTLIKRADMLDKHAVVLTQLEVMCGPAKLIALPKCYAVLLRAQEDAWLVPQEETKEFKCASCDASITAALAKLRVKSLTPLKAMMDCVEKCRLSTTSSTARRS
jgi:hypothetical protein